MAWFCFSKGAKFANHTTMVRNWNCVGTSIKILNEFFLGEKKSQRSWNNHFVLSAVSHVLNKPVYPKAFYIAPGLPCVAISLSLNVMLQSYLQHHRNIVVASSSCNLTGQEAGQTICQRNDTRGYTADKPEHAILQLVLVDVDLKIESRSKQLITWSCETGKGRSTVRVHNVYQVKVTLN